MNEFLKNAILYEIYPTSFYDGNGDGIGDFKGMIEKIDYIKSLGVNLLWLNPFYLSPFRDGGYDVQDFYTVDPRFGDLEDFREFANKCKENGIKVLIDLVVGHTSIDHEWFKMSSKAERNEYSDYYVWTDSAFTSYKNCTIRGMSERDGGFIINFFASQPALNYGFRTCDIEEEKKRSPKDNSGAWMMHYKDQRLKPLRDEIIKIMKFWLSNGADGFRVDMAPDMIKWNKYDTQDTHEIGWFWENIMTPVKEEYSDLIMLAEWICPPNAVKCGFDFDYTSHDTPEFNALYRNERHTNLSSAYEVGYNYFSGEGKGSIEELIKLTDTYQEKTQGKGTYSMPTGTHDEIRMMTGAKSIEQAKCVFAFLLTFRHLPMIYYGDEIGIAHNFGVRKDGGAIRTGTRTPMQWNDQKNRGFSTADTTYLPTNDHKGIDVESQEKDPNSLLNTVKQLIKIRKSYSCFNLDGKTEYIEKGYPLIYKRKDEKNTATVMINPSNKPITRAFTGKVLYSVNCGVVKNNVTLNAQSFLITIE